MSSNNLLDAYNIPFYEPKIIYEEQINIQDDRIIYPQDLVQYKQSDPITQKKQRLNSILQERQNLIKNYRYYKMDKIKNQLAGVAALLGVIAAIGGGFVKYGEIVTKLDALEAAGSVDTSNLEKQVTINTEKIASMSEDINSNMFQATDNRNAIDAKKVVTIV